MKKLTTAALSIIMIISSLMLNCVTASAAEAELTACAGWYESLYAVWSNDSNAENAVVYYKSSDSSQYLTVDDELVRANGTGGRVDIVGLSAGSYDIKIETASGNTITRTGIEVESYDRSGYAHFNYTDGVGAYNDDGTPKTNAAIIYVTNDNKNTVTYNGKTGIANILANAKSFTTPVIIRIIGTVDTCLWDLDKTQTTDLANGRVPIDGLASEFSTSDTSLNMANVKESQNITIEGIGDDAIIDRWGLSFSKSSSIEVRNITFQNYPEDACSFQGSSNTNMNAEHFWLHHCTFNIGLNWCDLTTEQDKGDGDGSADIKYCKYVTFAYNKFNNCHKTSLHGGGDSAQQYNVTWHHNYFNSSSSRLPLVRQANVHLYNNYYYGTKNQCIDARASAWVFSENNYFENASKPYAYTASNTYGNPVIKVYGDVRSNSNYTDSDHIILASSRTETYSFSDNSNPYPNFDTNSTVFYYDSTNSCSDVEHLTSAEEAKAECIEISGVLKTNSTIEGNGDIDNSEDNTSSEYILLPTDIAAATYTESVSSGIFTINAATDKAVTVSSDKIALGGSGNTAYRSITFATNYKGSVTITAVSGSTSETRTLAIINSDGTEIDTFPVSAEDTKTITLPSADTYYIYSKGSGINIKKVVVNVDAKGLLGDVDGNRNLNKLDAAIILRYCATNTWDSVYDFDVADINENGTVDILDAIYILNSLPQEETTEAATETTTAEAATEATTYVLNLTYGLYAGNDYNGISVLEDMKYNSSGTTINNITYSGYVFGSTNPSLTNDIPTSGAVLKFTPETDCKLTLVVKINAGKTYYFLKGDGTQINSYQNTSSDSSTNLELTYNLTAGETYYAYCAGSKMYIYYVSLS